MFITHRIRIFARVNRVFLVILVLGLAYEMLATETASAQQTWTTVGSAGGTVDAGDLNAVQFLQNGVYISPQAPLPATVKIRYNVVPIGCAPQIFDLTRRISLLSM